MTAEKPEGDTIQADIPADECPLRDTELIPPKQRMEEMRQMLLHLEADTGDPTAIRRGLYALHRISVLASSIRDDLIRHIYNKKN